MGLLLLAGVAFAAPEKPQPPPTVFVEKLVRSQLFDTLTYPARLMPRTSANLLAETEGVVTRIEADLGKPVRKGDTVLVIRNTDPVYKYAPLAVRSPVAGIMSTLDVTVGTRVARNQKIASVTDPKQIKIVVEAPAKDLSSIRSGMSALLSLPGRGEPVPVTVQGVSPLVDPGTGTATVELIPAAAAALSPGLVGRAAFRLNEHAGIQLPEHSIIYRGRNPTVRVVENGRARYVPVTLGPTRQGFVEILKGVDAGADVILRASTFVAEGETVTIQGEGASGS